MKLTDCFLPTLKIEGLWGAWRANCERSLISVPSVLGKRAYLALLFLQGKLCAWLGSHSLSVERLARSALINEIYIEVGRTWSSQMTTNADAQAFAQNLSQRGLSMIPVNITQSVIFVHTYQKKV